MFWKAKKLIPESLKPHTISWKIALFYTILFSSVLIALNSGTILGIRFFLAEQAKIQVQSSSNNLLEIIKKRASRPIHEKDLVQSDSNPALYIRVTDLNGNTIWSSGKVVTLNLNITSHFGETEIIHRDNRYFAVENNLIITKDGKPYGYLQVCYSMHAEYRFIRLLLAFMIYSDLLGILISIFAGHIISKRILKPVDLMTITAREICCGDLKNRVEVSGAKDELARLAITFNEMIERLQISFDKQTQFVSDASHELRTPISVIHGYADMVERWGKSDPKILEESMAAIYRETNHMTDLIEKLLFLARGDSNRIQLQKESFDLKQTIAEIVTESRLIAPQHQFSFEAEDKLFLCGDKRLIKQALRAMVENSVKYTPGSGSISIQVRKTGTEVLIDVQDNGIGICAKELPRIFDRFYRVDKGRSKETGGSGLGLSIVKWITEAHLGTVGIESEPGKGTRISLRLPLNET